MLRRSPLGSKYETLGTDTHRPAFRPSAAGEKRMDYHPIKAGVNDVFLRRVGGLERPTFFDIDAVCPALDLLTRNHDVIRAEWDRLERWRATMPRYHDIDPGQTKISGTVDPDKNWHVFMLYLLGDKPQANRARCPMTCLLLDRIPNLVQAFFSVLDAGKSVPRHQGPYLGYLRYHLGVKVPRKNPPELIVNGQSYVWREGEAVMFDDSWPHEVINHSAEPRVVLIVDVLRPLPTHLSLLNKLIVYGLARPTYYRKVLRRVEGAPLIPTK